MTASEKTSTILPSERTWVTKAGDTILIQNMSDEHIENSIRMMRRNGFISKKSLNFYLSSPGPSGDMASYAFEQEQARALAATESEVLGWLEDERDRRKRTK